MDEQRAPAWFLPAVLVLASICLLPAVALVIDPGVLVSAPPTPSPLTAPAYRMIEMSLLDDLALPVSPYLLFAVGVTLTAVGGATLGTVLGLRLSRRAAARAIALSVLLASAAGASGGVVLPYGVPAWAAPTGAGRIVIELAVAAAFLAAAWFGLRFLSLFPRRLEPSDVERYQSMSPDDRSLLDEVGLGRVAAWRRRIRARWSAGRATRNAERRRIDLPVGRILTWSHGPWSGVVFVVSCTLPYAIALLTFESLASVGTVLAGLTVLYASMFASGLAGDMLYTQFWTGGPAERRQLLWLLLGLQVTIYVVSVVYMAATVLVIGGDRVDLFGMVFALTVPLVALGLMASLAVAVFYQGALDPSLAIGKTTVYGLLGLVLAFAFGAAETFVERVVAVRTPLPASTADWVAGGFVAVLFAVLKSRYDGVAEAGPRGETEPSPEPVSPVP